MQTVVQFDTPLVFLLGDFNMVPSADLDRLSSSARDSSDLRQWADTFALTDVWRHMHPSLKEFTCHSSSHKTLSRIDLVYASGPVLQYVQEPDSAPKRYIRSHTLMVVPSLDHPPSRVSGDCPDSGQMTNSCRNPSLPLSVISGLTTLTMSPPDSMGLL